MAKKITALCVLLSINSIISANGYPATQGFEVPQHAQDHTNNKHSHDHHHSSDKIADEADQRRLTMLEEQDAAANMYTNLSRAGLVLGAGMIAAGIFTKKQTSNLVVSGTATFGLSAGTGWLVYQAGQGRAKERKDILDRRAKSKHHH